MVHLIGHVITDYSREQLAGRATSSGNALLSSSLRLAALSAF